MCSYVCKYVAKICCCTFYAPNKLIYLQYFTDRHKTNYKSCSTYVLCVLYVYTCKSTCVHAYVCTYVCIYFSLQSRNPANKICCFQGNFENLKEKLNKVAIQFNDNLKAIEIVIDIFIVIDIARYLAYIT